MNNPINNSINDLIQQFENLDERDQHKFLVDLLIKYPHYTNLVTGSIAANLNLNKPKTTSEYPTWKLINIGLSQEEKNLALRDKKIDRKGYAIEIIPAMYTGKNPEYAGKELQITLLKKTLDNGGCVWEALDGPSAHAQYINQEAMISLGDILDTYSSADILDHFHHHPKEFLESLKINDKYVFPGYITFQRVNYNIATNIKDMGSAILVPGNDDNGVLISDDGARILQEGPRKYGFSPLTW